MRSSGCAAEARDAAVRVSGSGHGCGGGRNGRNQWHTCHWQEITKGSLKSTVRKEKCIPNNQPCAREQVKKWWWEYGRGTVDNLGPTAISRPRYAQCARPRVDPFLTCLGRYLLNGSNRFVRRWRVIADVTLVRSNFYSLFLRTSTRHLKVGQEDCVGT